MPWGRGRRDSYYRDDDGGPPSNSFEDPDWIHAMNDYGAAVRDLPVGHRPPFAMDDWRTADAQPATPAWAQTVCPECGGDGASRTDGSAVCPSCGGRGTV